MLFNDVWIDGVCDARAPKNVMELCGHRAGQTFSLVVRDFSMNSGLIAAVAAITGSIVGALGSVVGTWIIQRHQDRRDLLAKRIVRREALYSDFIGESARLL